MAENTVITEKEQKPVQTQGMPSEPKQEEAAAPVLEPEKPAAAVSAPEPEKPAAAVSAPEPEKPAADEVSEPEQTFSELPAPVKKEIEKNLYLQYNNLEFSDRLMFEAAINDYCQKTGSPADHVEAVNLYVKPEEGKAYYVMNHDGEKIGFIDL